jgi:NodT family efflux transporter outer membrane factor (OMF) lipoprotein
MIRKRALRVPNLAPALAPLLLAPVLLATGCTTVGPDFERPAAPPAQAGYGAAQSAAVALGAGPEREWWKAFANPELDGLVAQALAQNHSLASSRATLERAAERIAAVRGRTRPQVDASTRAERERINLSAFGFTGVPGFDLENPTFNLFSVGGGVSYDLDLFGGNRRALEQAGAEAEAQARATQAAHLVIAGRVVAQVLALAALNDKIATERALLAEDDRNVRLTQARQDAGAGTLVEVLTAQSQLAGDRADLPALEQQVAEGRGMLAVLLGISPAELGATDFHLAQFALPATVPVALPSELVHKRPDILESEARLHAAVAEVGMATAALYPDITLGASLTQSAAHPGDLTSSNFNAFDVFAGLAAPIFHGGTLKAQKREAEAGARAAAEDYKQVVTEAFGQVAGLLAALDTDSRELTERRAAADISDRSLYLSRRSFQVGNSGVLQVLDASRATQRARLSLVDTRARQYQNIARLLVATAGGWEPSSRPGSQERTSTSSPPSP